eukprot:1620772-Prymnesium_polylepis.1
MIKGGHSLLVGVDDVVDFAFRQLHWQCTDRVLSLASRHTALLEKAIKTRAEQALAIIHDSLDHHDALPSGLDYDSAVDAADHANVIMVIEAGKLVLYPVAEVKDKMPTQLLPPNVDELCYATIHVP